tara:strand:- start:1034 stop:2263 length:1230 start_codon:yes stop_codon:yes gene_type:complete
MHADTLMGRSSHPGREARIQGTMFSYMSYGEAVKLMQELSASRPDLASLSTAQKRYGLPTAGTCTDVDGSRSPCLNHILEITNRTSARLDPSRPEMLISGALHGDERIGPITVLELARWLIERYETDGWVRRLVNSRVVILVPMTNAIGVATNTRSELGIDPNRDFPYDQKQTACMQTVTARVVNELYRSYLLQLTITFHGGMQAIGYNWGAFPYYSGKPHRSPDDNSMRTISEAMSRFAGTGNVRGNRRYPTGPMNDAVYPVHGGMEDWGYAASWDKQWVQPCTPRTHGGYPLEKSRYTDSQARVHCLDTRRRGGVDSQAIARRAPSARLGHVPSHCLLSCQVRTFTVLVEAADAKAPPQDTLGGQAGVYAPGSAADGICETNKLRHPLHPSPPPASCPARLCTLSLT